MVTVFGLILALMVSAGEKHLWAELLAFDNARPDYGVREYLARMDRKPSIISFLMPDPDLVHSHIGMDRDYRLEDSDCSYCARSGNEERPRQKWTAWQLRGLVSELRSHGVGACPAFFDFQMAKNSEYLGYFNAKRRETTWLDRHPEICYRMKDGSRSANLNPIERFADGTDYAEFFVPRLIRFLKDYGFAGFHACDGFGHPRYSIDQLDYTHLFPGAKDRAAVCRAHAARHAAFIGRTAEALHAEGMSLFVNTAWTRDPLEALYRYGIDYRLMQRAGIDGFYAEASATVLELEGWVFSPVPPLDERRAAFLVSGSLLDVPFYHLACVKDGMEQYNSLRDAPRRVEAEVIALGSIQRGGRSLTPGVLWCLADGISSGEWKRLDHLRSFASLPARADGLAVVYAPSQLDAELDAYARDGWPSSYTLLSSLLKAGAAVNACVSLEEALGNPSLPVLVLNPGRWNRAELEALRSGRKTVEFGYGAKGCEFGPAPSALDARNWLYPLPARELPESACRAAVGRINAISPVYPASVADDLRVISYLDGAGDRVVVALNSRPVYLNSRIGIRAKVTCAKALTDAPSLPIRILRAGDEESVLEAKLPPSGVVAIRLKGDR